MLMSNMQMLINSSTPSCSRLNSAPTTTTRALNNNPIPLTQSRRRLSTHIHDIYPVRLLIPPHDEVQPRRTVPSTFHTIWSPTPPLTEDRALHRHSELDLSHRTVSTLELALTTRSGPQSERAEDAGIPLLKDLRVRDTRVGHVGVHTALAIPGGTRTGATGDGLVVAEAILVLARDGVFAARAEGEVVAAALGGGGGAEGLEDDVGDALGGKDVAAHDGEAGRGVEEGVLRDDDEDGGQTALVQGDGGVDQGAEAVDDGGVGDGDGRVGVAEDLGSGAGEVEGGGAVGTDRDAEGDGCAVVHVVRGCQRLVAILGEGAEHELADC